ncbi:hypothetical protein CFP56_002623 [Quercus suber]|uniref:DUF4219 domain-containing protein n=1 Tax=Quercus suber TaxID=58331 RepID=A0AAW0IJZ6_QUESU
MVGLVRHCEEEEERAERVKLSVRFVGFRTNACTLVYYAPNPTNIERLHSIPAIIKRLISNPTVIKRLDDVDNYKDWSLQVKTYLTDQQLWDIVEGTNEPSKAENDEDAFKAWS